MWGKYTFLVVGSLTLACQPNSGSSGQSGAGSGESGSGSDVSGSGEEASSGSAACEDPGTQVLWAFQGEALEPMELVPSETFDGLDVARSWQGGLGTLTLEFATECSGPVYLWTFAWDEVGGTETDNADSFYVMIDEDEEFTWQYGCNTPASAAQGRWAWLPIQVGAEEGCEQLDLALDLEAGDHAIVYRNRENGVGINVAAMVGVVVSRDPFADPYQFLEPPPPGE